MQRNNVVSLRPAAAWQRALGFGCADDQATYGCVDWYLYRHATGASADSTGVHAAPCSSIIEHAVAAAGTAVARSASSAEAGAQQSAC
jgi:hypothetical protein